MICLICRRLATTRAARPRRPYTATSYYTTTSRTRWPPLLPRTQAAQTARTYSSPSSMTPAEAAIAELLRAKLDPTDLVVRDISGGCGSMYAIDIASPVFRGASMLKQQRMVNAALGDVVKQWHGVQLNTRVSEPE